MIQKYGHLAFSLLFVFGLFHFAKAQILDDTTKVKYGPKTTRYFTEFDLIHNRKVLFSVDTSLTDFHDRGDFIYGTNLQKNLGVLGTPTQNQFYQTPDQIGISLGQNGLNPYAYNPQKLKYYNTQSPSSSVEYIQGGRPRQILKTLITRNVNRNLNLGFNYTRMTALRMINVSEAEQRQVDHSSLALHGNYVSSNNKYIALINYTHFNHLVYETGGVYTGENFKSKDSLFDFQVEPAKLFKDARNRELRNIWHFYHQFSLDAKGHFQLFHIFDRVRQINRFTDPQPAVSPDFYGDTNYLYDSKSELFSLRKYQLYENKLGIKGRLGKVNYSGYIRHKNFRFIQNPISFSGIRNETFIGGFLEYRYADSTLLESMAETNPGRDYLLKISVKKYWGGAEYQKLAWSPTILQSGFISNPLLYYFNTNYGLNGPSFKLSAADRFNFFLNLKWKKLEFNPFLESILLRRHIYFNEQFTPTQNDGLNTINYLGIQLNIQLRKWSFQSHYRMSRVTGLDVIRMPKQYFFGRFFYKTIIRNNSAVALHAGLDMRWKSSYYCDAYQPLTMQYHIQNTFLIDPYILIEPFVELKIKRAMLYFKIHNVNQNLGAPGYFMTPYYPGQRRLFEFGVNWQFFD